MNQLLPFNKKNKSLEGRLFFAFLFMGLIVLIVSIIGWIATNRLSTHIHTLGNDAFPSVVNLWKIKEGQTQIQSSERSQLNPATSPETRQNDSIRIKNAWKQINEGFSEYEKLTRDPEQDELYKTFLPLWNKWKEGEQEYQQLNQAFERLGILNPRQVQINLLTKGKANSPEFAAAQAAVEVLDKMNEQTIAKKVPTFKEATDALLALLTYNENLAADARQSAAADVRQSTFWILGGLLVGPVVAVIFGKYFSNTIALPLGAKIAGVVGVAERISIGDLTTQVEVTEEEDEIGKLLTAFRAMSQNLNSLIHQVQQSGVQITTSATQIAASGKQLEATVAEQVASTNEVVATAKQIATTSGKLVKTMDEVAETSQVTAAAADDSQKDLSRMEATMRKLAGATSGISGKLGVISEKANNINSIVTTITKVADQTNLLSLNAAIEAEKAGEYGMGFAVVAREIRRLADQTAVATLDIESMVKEMQSAVSTGVMEMDKFTKEVEHGVEGVQNISMQIGSIIEQVQVLTPRFQMVSEGMEAQSESAQQISEAMVQLSEASLQTADSLRGINIAIGQLNEASHGLRQEVSRFKV
ncbi:methyl-accepting chemotaxis protein [Scytonema sp. UIC 10036]|uniref:methyl-accepting chemotaxis protein n=1 Tax=Scytonema sp. UIC 10036 TaxID=2304196 RepID=UPI0012DAAA69|nr:methyl-accepting chemotaxis protein [Scytonema sp. UIC 10036]MUG91070.1 methyl-accepting chemotaxis protein [Scytonema sp. UIC 10036]